MTAVARRNDDKLTCVIMAAGSSSRLGMPKQLVRHRGRPLLERAAAAAAEATLRDPVVVVGHEALRLRAALRRSGARVTVIRNALWRQGLASSLRAGLRGVPPDAGAVLLMLADQPWVEARSLRRLIRAWRRHPSLPAAARYAGRVGVPAIIPRRLWPALRRLEGDQGARAVLHGAPRLTVVDLPEAVFDVDRPEDLETLRRRGAGRPRRRSRS